MPREIKFRAWDKELGRMFDFNRLVVIAGRIEIDFHPYLEAKTWNRLELMQFTGLKDKNGKEIYEGDVIRMKSTGARTIHEVKFRDGSFEVSLIPIQHAFVRTDPEIIGNIYENPDLLTA
jgi:uncharacterized phage protein (TIGR01671 family)